MFWTVVPPKIGFSFSERVEVHIAHPQAGIIVLIEEEQRRVDHGREQQQQQMDQKVQIMSNVKIICQSPDGSKFAYITTNEKEQHTVWVGFQDYFKKELMPTKITKTLHQPIN